MSEHVTPERLVGFVDGEIRDAGERAAIAAHLEGCVVCKMDHDALAGLEGTLRDAALRAGAAESEVADPRLEANLAQLAHAALTGASCKIVNPSAAAGPSARRRPAFVLLAAMAAAAAGLVLWLSLRSEPGPERLRVLASSRAAPGVSRGPDALTWSLEAHAVDGGFPAVVALGPDTPPRIVYPDPNPVIADLQAEWKIRPRVRTRIPKDSALDFELAAGEREFLVVVAPTRWDRESLARLARSLAGTASEPAQPAAFAAYPQTRIALPLSGR